MRIEKKRNMYYQLLRIRMIEQRIALEYKEQQMRCPVHLCIGQEAIAVGVCEALTPEDYVVSTHRSHGHYLAKGGDLKALLAELYGRRDGCCRGKGGSMHVIDLNAGFLGAVPIVASSIPIAVGASFGIWQKEEDRVTVVFFGDGATEEGVFHECLNFASLYKLPIVFVCENNFFSVYSSLAVRRPKEQKIYKLAEAHGIQTAFGDGNNIEEVNTCAKKAIDSVRAGNGPWFLEFETYRWLEHCGPNYDNHLGYRKEEDFLKWKERCPVKNFEKYLIANNIIDRTDITEIENSIAREIDEAFEFAMASEFPDSNEAFNDLYALKL